LKTLYLPGVGKNNMDPAFKTSGYLVWSEPDGSSSAWVLDFGAGSEISEKISGYCEDQRVFAVRSRPR
jgi:hypothetical protein